MKTIAIWGATSGLGATMAEYFHNYGYKVIGIARNPGKNARLAELGILTISCDATVQHEVQAAVDSLPTDSWVVSTMGSFQADVPVDYIGHRYLPDGAKAAFGAAVREKSLAEAWLKSSKLDFTILRPGGLKDGTATGQAQLSQDTEVHGLINRIDVADLTRQLLERNDSIGQTYQCIDLSLTY